MCSTIVLSGFACKYLNSNCAPLIILTQTCELILNVLVFFQLGNILELQCELRKVYVEIKIQTIGVYFLKNIVL